MKSSCQILVVLYVSLCYIGCTWAELNALLENPFLASIYVKNTLRCYGALISANHALTANQCLYDVVTNQTENSRHLNIIAGALQFNKTTYIMNAYRLTEKRNVIRVIVGRPLVILQVLQRFSLDAYINIAQPAAHAVMAHCDVRTKYPTCKMIGYDIISEYMDAVDVPLESYTRCRGKIPAYRVICSSLNAALLKHGILGHPLYCGNRLYGILTEVNSKLKYTRYGRVDCLQPLIERNVKTVRYDNNVNSMCPKKRMR